MVTEVAVCVTDVTVAPSGGCFVNGFMRRGDMGQQACCFFWLHPCLSHWCTLEQAGLPELQCGSRVGCTRVSSWIKLLISVRAGRESATRCSAEAGLLDWTGWEAAVVQAGVEGV